MLDPVPGRVSVIVPCRNERRYLEAFCIGVLGKALPVGRSLQLIIADGASDDGSSEMLQRIGASDPRIECVANPRRIVSTGLNAALERASGEVIVRMDVHTDYAPDYIAACLATLAASGADNVGGPWCAEPEPGAGPTQRAVAAAFQSRWVAGGARSRSRDYDGWVDTVYLGCWPRACFERFGGFDESLVRNQDDEHNLRIVRGGGRIWQSSAIRSRYRPRATLRQVLRQYLQYGYWKPFVMKKHGQVASIRHLVPGGFVALLGITAVVALVGGPRWPVALLGFAYLMSVAALSFAVVRGATSTRAAKATPNDATAIGGELDAVAACRVPLVVVAYHLGYGIGSLFGAWDAARGVEGRPGFASLTR